MKFKKFAHTSLQYLCGDFFLYWKQERAFSSSDAPQKHFKTGFSLASMMSFYHEIILDSFLHALKKVLLSSFFLRQLILLK
jgi:hypothetical protein